MPFIVERRPRQHGFSLLEVLIAFSILAMALGVLLSIFSRSLNNTRDMQDYARATLWAESLMSGVGSAVPLEEGDEDGGLGERMHWRRSIRAYPLEEDVLGARRPVQPYRVTVEVFWGEDERRRDVTLTSLRLKPRKREGGR
ncbi:MAG: type IV pilus modification PilV family protein [Gammaproteobacteria bacterium]